MQTANQNGITLTELLVASILIGIVMIGVASFSVSIQKLQSATNRSSVIAMRTTAVMNRMVKDAYLAVGDEANRGVVAGSGGTGSICFRHDADNNPATYTGDDWVCYYGRPNRELWLCGDGAVPPVNNWGNCSAGNGEIRLLDLEDTDITRVVNTPDGRFEYVEITIFAIFQRTGTYHPIDNPSYTLTTQVSPPGHSG